jgi:hypothetical protein
MTLGIQQALILLLTAHVLVDFLFRSEDRARAGAGPAAGRSVLRGGILTLVTFILLAPTPTSGVVLWRVPLALGLLHSLLDLSRSAIGHVVRDRASKRKGETSVTGELCLFIVDQFIHVVVLFGAAALVAYRTPPVAPVWLQMWGTGFLRACMIVMGLIVAAKVGKALIGISIAPFARGGVASPPDERAGGPDIHSVIGQLERTMVFFPVLTGNLSAVGFVIAAKSVFRFGDLKDPKQRDEAEFILVGTMMSFTWALLVGWLTSHLLGNAPVLNA